MKKLLTGLLALSCLSSFANECNLYVPANVYKEITLQYGADGGYDYSFLNKPLESKGYQLSSKNDSDLVFSYKIDEVGRRVRSNFGNQRKVSVSLKDTDQFERISLSNTFSITNLAQKYENAWKSDGRHIPNKAANASAFIHFKTNRKIQKLIRLLPDCNDL